jgi:propanol-preferring alcohol dehydrogenase
MKAALLTEFGKPLKIDEAPKPAPERDEVLIQVEASGVCHSDLHMALGDWPDTAARMTLPATLGHEAVGRVVEVGAAATGIQLGDRVGVGWLHWTCGQCEHCRAGAENVCLDRKVTGVAAPGGFAEFMPVKASHAIAVPEELKAEQAAPLFCAGLTVYHACKNAGIAAGQSVAVFGVGGLGHIAIQLAANAGAEVTAVDVSGAKLKLARTLGAKHTVNAGSASAVDELKRKGGPHVAVVTAPAKPAYDLAFRTLRRRGTLAAVGIPKEHLTFFADDLVVGQFRILGSAVGTRQDMREVLALAAAGKLRCEVETHPLEAINDIFERMTRGEIAGRAVLKLT